MRQESSHSEGRHFQNSWGIDKDGMSEFSAASINAETTKSPNDEIESFRHGHYEENLRGGEFTWRPRRGEENILIQ